MNSNNMLTEIENDSLRERSTAVIVPPTAPSPWIDSSPQQSASLASYLEIPFKHKWLICLCTLLGILLGWAAILLMPRSYESVAKIRIKVGRENVSLDPTATMGSAVMSLEKTQREEIQTLLDVLDSRQVAERVVDALGPDAILDGELPAGRTNANAGQDPQSDGGVGFSGDMIRERLVAIADSVDDALFDLLFAAGIKDDISDRELAIRRIREYVDCEAPKDSSVVGIHTTAESPELAQAIVEEVTNAFLALHLEGSYTAGSYDFFVEQSKDLETQLNELLAERAKFMQNSKVISIEANQEMLSTELSGIDRDLAVAAGQLEQVEAEVADIERKMAEIADEVVSEKVRASDQTWSAMRQQIYDLEIEEQNLAARYTSKHPGLQRVRKQLTGAWEILADLDSERIDESTQPNPIKTELKQVLQQKQTLAVGLRSMITETQNRRAALEQEANELLEHERHLTRLDRDIELQVESVRLMRQKLEEARVIDELQADRFSNIHVFQPASYVERAVSPNKKLLGAGFAFFGLLSGLTLSFLREGSSPAIRTADDVEVSLGVPVVSSITRLKNAKPHRIVNHPAYRKCCRAVMSEILMTQHRSASARGLSLGIIGVDDGSGASSLAVNLAVTSDVDCHLKTMLVDADLRKRSVSKMFGLNGAPGLFELVNGAASHDECLQKSKSGQIELIASSSDECVDVMSSSAPEIAQALRAYLQDCDLLIVDLPSACQPDQASALAQHLDCIVVVAESEKTNFVAAERLLNRLSRSDSEIIGVVLTKTRSYLPKFIRGFVSPRT